MKNRFQGGVEEKRSKGSDFKLGRMLGAYKLTSKTFWGQTQVVKLGSPLQAYL